MSSRAVQILFAITLLAALVLRGQNIGGKVSGGFQVPAARDNEGRRSVLKGSAGTPIGKSQVEITDPQLTSFKPDDTQDLIIESPKCIFDTEQNVAFSDSTLSVRTADGRFSIKGLGWRWDRSTSRLVVSNNVVADIRKAALASASPTLSQGSSTNDLVRITSKDFVHESDSAIFGGNVHVEDGSDRLDCEQLIVSFLGGGGVRRIEAIENVSLVQAETEVKGGKAIYDVQKNTIELQGKTQWKAGLREGASDSLLLNRSNNTFFAHGSVYMKLPLTNLVSTNANSATPTTNQFLEVRSEKFAFENATTNGRPSHARYEEQVRVNYQDAEIRCARLDVHFSTNNQVVRAVAQLEVEIQSGSNKAFSELAIYEIPEDKISLTISPRWELEDKTGSSKTLIFYPRRKEVYALDDVEMVLPGESLGALNLNFGATNAPAKSGENVPMRVLASSFSQQGDLAVFRNNVRVVDAAGQLECAILSVTTGASNQVQRIVAEDQVRITQPGFAATGDRADYNVATGLVHVTGGAQPPKIITADRTAEASAFIIDRKKNTFSMAPGNWRITMKAKERKPAP